MYHPLRICFSFPAFTTGKAELAFVGEIPEKLPALTNEIMAVLKIYLKTYSNSW
jgi:hypothetical protein